MKFTREQYNKWNAAAHNDFNFDFEHAVIWSEKRLTKRVPLENGVVIEFLLDYYNEYETHTNYGCKWNVETGRQIPHLVTHEWHPASTPGVFTDGTGNREKVGEIQKNKNYNYLCKLSDDPQILARIEEITNEIAQKLNTTVKAA